MCPIDPTPAEGRTAAALNDQGWALLNRTPRTTEGLAAAEALFRKALEPPAEPRALGNLANTLLALGRADDAIATLEAAAPRADVGHQALNWLGWYFTTQRPDLPRAVDNLQKAVARKPAWGAAWGNLGWALDRSGAEREAVQAYLEAIACGDFYDVGFLCKRSAELEAALQARGDTPVMPIAGGFAASRVERVNDVGRAIIRALAAMPEFATDHVFVLGTAQPLPTSEVPTAWIGSKVAGRLIVHALIKEHGAFSSVDVLARTSDGVVFRDAQIKTDEVGGATLLVADWLRAGGARPDADLTPLDVAVALRDLFNLTTPGLSGWRIKGGAQYRNQVVIDELGAATPFGVSATCWSEGGVHVELLPEAMGGKPSSLNLVSAADLAAQKPAIVEATKRALAARDAWSARPFTLKHALDILVPALERAYPAGRWTPSVMREAYPARWASASINLAGRHDARTMATLGETVDGCSITIKDVVWTVCSEEDVRAQLSVMIDRATARIRAFPPDALAVGRSYRVIKPIEAFVAQEVVQLIDERDVQYDRFDFMHVYDFVSTSRPDVRVSLSDATITHMPIVSEIDRYLTPI